METKEITIHVTPEAAGIYETASEQERLKLDTLLNQAAKPSRSLKEVINEATKEAQENGLTEDALLEILGE